MTAKVSAGVRKRAFIRAQFARQGGKCWWCGKAINIIADLTPGYRIKPDDATLEHLDSRLNPMRGQVEGQRRVVACSQCNQARGAAELKALPQEVQACRAQWQHQKVSYATKYDLMSRAVIRLLKDAVPGFMTVQALFVSTTCPRQTIEEFMSKLLLLKMAERIPSLPKAHSTEGQVYWRWVGPPEVKAMVYMSFAVVRE